MCLITITNFELLEILVVGTYDEAYLVMSLLCFLVTNSNHKLLHELVDCISLNKDLGLVTDAFWMVDQCEQIHKFFLQIGFDLYGFSIYAQ